MYIISVILILVFSTYTSYIEITSNKPKNDKVKNHNFQQYFKLQQKLLWILIIVKNSNIA